ncbi:MAG: MFS transporter [Chloroflexi bacterium]|nr:MFS transporter [Chloroflexota bacterium]
MMKLRRPQSMLMETMMVNFVQTITSVVMPVLARERIGASSWLLGIYGAVCFLAYAVAAQGSGYLGDRLGRRPMMLAGISVIAVSLLAVVGAHGPLSFALAFLISGIGYGVFWPALEGALIDGQTSRQINTATGVFCYSWMTATAIGSIIMGALHHWGLAYPVIAGWMLLAVCAVLLFWPGAMEIAPWGERDVNGDIAVIDMERRKLFVRLAMAANLVMYFIFGGYRVLLAVYADAPGVGITGWRFGLLSGINMMGMAGCVGLLMVWRGWHYSLRWLVGVELGAAVLLILFVFTNHYWLLVLLALLLGLPGGVCYFSAFFYGMALHESKSAHGGNFEGLIGLGLGVGPLVGGYLIIQAQNLQLSFAPRAYLLADVILLGLLIAVQLVLASRLSDRSDPAAEKYKTEIARKIR